VNVDLCFVPAEHMPQVKLPAVSGSSGRLVVERMRDETEPSTWPGWIFGCSELDYEEAMQGYISATRERLRQSKSEAEIKVGRKAEKQALQREEERLREERYQVREQRKQEDRLWRAYRKQYKARQSDFQALPEAERLRQTPSYELLRQEWCIAWDQRQQNLRKREIENLAWQAQRKQLRERSGWDPHTNIWFAILVITDNCTRQCLGLPLFVAGSKVTSEMVVQALEVLLPKKLQYLISDQGTHFRTLAFAQLAQRKDFIWVPIARHRAQSNGIAERFVRTLKEWLADKAWQSAQELEAFLATFQLEYNERPHQGLPIPGLSPNEFAKRLWLM
jgi:transposase InsO family protein